MAWNDGITKELSDYMDGLLDLGDAAVEAAKSVIDTEVAEYSKNVESKIPVKTGGLKASFSTTKVTDRGRNYYGSDVSFNGNAPNGEPYQKIANVLNYGDEHHAGTQFVSNAIRKLKGMDDRINARIEEEISKRTE